MPEAADEKPAQNGLEDLLTFDDLAARWHCSRKTIKANWANYGFRPVRIARRVLIPVSQVIELEKRMIDLIPPLP